MKQGGGKKAIETNNETKDNQDTKKEDKSNESAGKEINESHDDSDSYMEFTSDSCMSSDYFDELDSSTAESTHAWEDSDSDAEMADALQNVLKIEEGDSRKKFKKTETEKIETKTNIFTARCMIKLFKVFDDVAIIVDAFNLVYVADAPFKEIKTYKFKFFRISDFIKLDDVVYFCSDTSPAMHMLNIKTGEINAFTKKMGSCKEILQIGNKIYARGEKLTVMSSSLMYEGEFKETFAGMCGFNGDVVCLKSDGTIYMFDETLKYKSKLELSDKFTFKGVHANGTNLFIATETGITILNKELKVVKEICNTKIAPEFFAFTDKCIMYASQMHQHFRILHADTFKPVETFPHKLLGFKTINGITARANTLFIAMGKDVVEINLETNSRE